MKEGFSPEFLGRIGTTVRFQKLEEEHCRGIIDVHLSAVNDRLSRYYVETNYHV